MFREINLPELPDIFEKQRNQKVGTCGGEFVDEIKICSKCLYRMTCIYRKELLEKKGD